MKTILKVLFIICLISCKTDKENIITMDQTNQINQTVSNLFIQTDNRNWQELATVFNDTVLLDYSSFGARAATELASTEIINSWKNVLPGFEHTHHQIGNLITTISENKAYVFCYGTATHYLNDENGNLWSVVGSYDFELTQVKNQWKVTAMKFNFKYQDGNLELIQKAIARVTDR